jgi:hypothetical protein
LTVSIVAKTIESRSLQQLSNLNDRFAAVTAAAVLSRSTPVSGLPQYLR